MCKTCQKLGSLECDSPVREKKKDDRTKRTTRPGTIRERRKAIKLVERKLKAAYLYTPTGFPLHPGGEQSQDVLSSECSKMVAQPGEISDTGEQGVEPAQFDDLQHSALDCDVLQRSPI